MFVFGWGNKTKALGPGPVETCTSCGSDARRVVLERVGYFSVFFIPVIRQSKFHEICSVCHQGHKLESRQAAQQRLAEARAQHLQSRIDEQVGQPKALGPIAPAQNWN